MRRILFVAVLAISSACAAARGDELARERERAAETARRIELEWPLAPAGPISDYVRRLGARLGRVAGDVPWRWRFTVVRDRAANAFAIGDGRIYVTEGVVAACSEEAEVAAVLAHEMGHQLAGHLRPERPEDRPFGTLRGGSESKSVGSVTLPIEPDKEREADHWSLSLLAKAGYDPHAALTAARRLAGRGDRGARHLGGAERLAALRDLLADVPRQGQRDSSEFRELQQSLGAVP